VQGTGGEGWRALGDGSSIAQRPGPGQAPGLNREGHTRLFAVHIGRFWLRLSGVKRRRYARSATSVFSPSNAEQQTQ
jgi:hypothetical protein